MKLTLRRIEALEEALRLCPRLDASAAQFMAQFSDAPFPAGASERTLRATFDERESLLLIAETERGAEPLALCWIGPFRDPLLGTTQPLVLVLYVDASLRHRGVAGELIADAERILATRGLHHLAARAAHNDDALISMGERWGFVRTWELMVKE